MRVQPRFHETPPVTVPYGSALELPAAYGATAEGSDLPYRVTIEVATDEDGPRCTSFTCEQLPGGPAVTTEGLRAIPLGRILRASVELAAIVPNEFGGGGWPAHDDELARAESEVLARQRRRVLTDEFLREVAGVYEKARRQRRAGGVPAPTAAVAEHFNTSRPTAGRWVGQARQRGLLVAPIPNRRKK